MAPLWKIQKFSGNFFFILGVGGKKTPPPWGIEDILGKVFWGPENFRHFGQQTVATQKPHS